MTTPDNVAALATRLVDLEDRAAAIKAQIDDVKARLLDAVEVGGTISVGDIDLYRVRPGKRTFKADKAVQVLPPSVLPQVTVERIDGTLVKRLSPAYWEACCTVGEPYLAAVK